MYDEHEGREFRDLTGKSPGEIARLAALNILLQEAKRGRLQSLHEQLERYLAILGEHVPAGGSLNVILSGANPHILTLCKNHEGEIVGYDVADAVLSVDLGTTPKPTIVPESMLRACDIHEARFGTVG